MIRKNRLSLERKNFIVVKPKKKSSICDTSADSGPPTSEIYHASPKVAGYAALAVNGTPLNAPIEKRLCDD